MTLSARYWISSGRLLAVAMLLTLHMALWAGVQSDWSRPLLFVHLGFFLLWQPLWRGEEKLRKRSALIIVGVCVVALFWLNWWMLAFWVSGLFAVLGGRVFAFQSALQRIRYLLAMAYLMAVLLVWLVPHLFELTATTETSKQLMEWVLPMLLLGMLFVPYEAERLKKTVSVDLIYSILLFMLLTLLVLGSLTFMSLGKVDYFQALLHTLFFMALVLFTLGWLWNPLLGFSGFQVIFSRYFLNIGTPFELWLKQLGSIAQQESSPEIFLKLATADLVELPWLTGLKWEGDFSKGQQGSVSKFTIEWCEDDLHLLLYTRQRVAPTVLMHIHLLCQMLAYFYQSKRREQRLREMARLQAVYETGARLTHDLKNMLQSLLVLISVAEQKPLQAQPILVNQLPVLAKQIELALTKLKVPKQETDTGMMTLANWWANLQQRQQFRNLDWLCEVDPGEQLVPYALFDNVIDNFIENARNKRVFEVGIAVQVSLRTQPLGVCVCDSGNAIAEVLAAQLLHTVVDSDNGLGIGLFQAARWAEQLGYRLQLQENSLGKVCFELNEAK